MCQGSAQYNRLHKQRSMADSIHSTPIWAGLQQGRAPCKESPSSITRDGALSSDVCTPPPNNKEQKPVA